ncbi:hypothetical protein TNCV_2722371 [Trichonephila clavipes]|nr:hypothetical protein TNCV_2722371 [Trichonephila clavipes]
MSPSPGTTDEPPRRGAKARFVVAQSFLVGNLGRGVPAQVSPSSLAYWQRTSIPRCQRQHPRHLTAVQYYVIVRSNSRIFFVVSNMPPDLDCDRSRLTKFIMRERISGSPTSLPLPPTSREDLQLDGYLEYPQTSLPSPGFEPRSYTTAVSVVNHYTEWATVLSLNTSLISNPSISH